MSDTDIDARIASKPALAKLLKTNTVQAYEIGYVDGFQDRYEKDVADGRKQRDRVLIPAVADGFRKGSSPCGAVLQTRRKRTKK